MKSTSSWRQAFVAAACLIVVAGCDEPCFVGPCPLEFAIEVTIRTSGSNTSIADAFVRDAAHPETVFAGCSGSPAVCRLSGAPATYNLEIGAPGFRSVTRTVVVTATGAKCGCDFVNEEHVDVSLTPAP